jgi:hypothetical protein
MGKLLLMLLQRFMMNMYGFNDDDPYIHGTILSCAFNCLNIGEIYLEVGTYRKGGM